MGNEPKRTHQIVAFRTFYVDVKVEAPTVGALEDWEKAMKAKLRRAVNTQATAKQHGVRVSPPGTTRKPSYSDLEYLVLTSAMPSSRRGR